MAEEHATEKGRKDVGDCGLEVNKSTEEDPKKQNLWSRSVAQKWILTLFVGTSLLYCARMVMPVCAVSMASTFHWSKIGSGLVLGGFFWGYCVTQVLGGHASDKIGGERVLFISTVLWTLITAATPLLAQLGSHTLALMTLARFIMGLLQGVFYLSLASLCSQRVVEGERGFLMSIMNSGSHLGMLLSGGMGSLLLDRYGWESLFYAAGSLSAVWAIIVWQCLLKGSGEPASEQLETSNGSEWRLSGAHWLSLCRKSSVWAMVFAHMCMCSTSYTLLSWLPTYFKESFPHAKGCVYNVIPWLVAIPSALGGGYVSDLLINQGYSVSFVRKLMQVRTEKRNVITAVYVVKVFCHGRIEYIFNASVWRCHIYCTSAVILVSAAVSLFTFSSGGVSVNVQDLTPSCAGALFGFMNMLGALMGVVLVSSSGYLIEVTLSWTKVFSLITLVNATGLGIFLVFGDARRVDLERYSELTVM